MTAAMGFMEGQRGLCWDLQTVPRPRVHHGVLRQGTIPAVPPHGHLGRGFLYKFFEYQSSIFGPLVEDYGTRYVAYQAMEMKNPLHDTLESAEKERKIHRWQAGLNAIIEQEELDYKGTS